MAATIFSPLSGDTVTDPITLVVGYSTQVPLTVTCSVDTTDERNPPQLQPPGGVRTSSAIPLNNAQNVTKPVFAKDGPTQLDTQANINIRPANGTPPVSTGPIVEPPPPPPPLPLAAANPGRKKRKVSGECDPAVKASYVICRILEIDVTQKTRTEVGNKKEFVKVNAGKHEWQAEIDFPMDATTTTLQYVARTTAYDSNDKEIGTHTKFFTK